jgi:lipoate:protein ligase-like protein
LFIAAGQGLESLPGAMDRFDPGGILACGFYHPETCTSLAREIGRTPAFDEMAERLTAAYRTHFGAARDRDLSGAEIICSESRTLDLNNWIAGRQPAPSLNMTARQSIQIGLMEARMAADHGKIDRIEFYGDFIANSPGLAVFEQSVAGQRLDLMTLAAVAMRTYGDGSNFILGCGELTNVAQLILSAR